MFSFTSRMISTPNLLVSFLTKQYVSFSLKLGIWKSIVSFTFRYKEQVCFIESKLFKICKLVSWEICLTGFLTLFRMGIFGATHGWGRRGQKRLPFAKICHTYPTVMELGTVIPYLKKIQKIYESRDTPTDFCWHQYFLIGNQLILFYQEIRISIAF